MNESVDSHYNYLVKLTRGELAIATTVTCRILAGLIQHKLVFGLLAKVVICNHVANGLICHRAFPLAAFVPLPISASTQSRHVPMRR